MATYDLGDVVVLTAAVRDADGVLADATTVTCTITLPDATTATKTVSHPSTGTYTTSHTTTVVGRHVARWVATGTNAAAFTDDFLVVSGVQLLTVDDLEAHLGRTISAADQASADAAVDMAAAVIAATVGFDITTATGVTSADLTAVKGLAVRAATQWFTNPEDRAAYSGPEGLSWTAGTPLLARIMSPSDLDLLRSIALRYDIGFA